MRQHPKDKDGLQNSPSAKGATGDSSLLPKNRAPPPNKSQTIIEMTDVYPFGQAKTTNNPCLVRLIYNFRPAEYAELKRTIQLGGTLKHRNLISTIRVLESKTSGQFQVFLQYVEEGLESVLPMLTNEEVIRAKIELVGLCRFLIEMGITPQLSSKNIGFSRKCIKLYLDIRRLVQKGSRKDTITSKQIQIQNLFNRLLYQKTSIPVTSVVRNFNTSRSQEIIANQPTFTFMEKTSEESRNTSLTNFHKKPTDNRVVDISKIRNIDEKIREIQQHMTKPAIKQSRPSHFSNNESLMKKAPPDQKVNTALHSYMEAHQYGNLRQGRDAPIVYPTIGLALAKYEEEDSFDTYNQELGEDAELPKITHKEMRQTTKSPPRLIFRDKLCESVGNSRNNILAMTANQQTAEKVAKAERMNNARSTSADKSSPYQSKLIQMAKNNSSREEVSTPQPQSRGPFQKPPPEERVVKRSTNRISDLSHSDDRAYQLIAREAQKRLEEHLNEIRNVQRDISIRKLSLGKAPNDPGKKSERKFTEPRPRAVEPQEQDSPLKYYKLEGGLVAEFNGLMASNTDISANGRSSNIFERGSELDQRKMEINERVKLALKKSEETLVSFRNRMAWKTPKLTT